MSFVNKSGKRFVPKLGGRRSGRVMSLSSGKNTGERGPLDRETPEDSLISEDTSIQRAFAQPQRRLNSLTTPTQLLEQPSGPSGPSVRSRRGSVVANNTSTINNRRPSIVKTSRRGSSVVVDDVSVGGVITGSNNIKDSPVGINMGEPIRIPINRRKSSVSSIPINNKRRRSSARLNNEVSQVVKQRVKEAVKNVEMLRKKQQQQGTSQVINTPISVVAPVKSIKKVEPDHVVISKGEQDANFKWMMSKSQKKLIKVDVSLLNVEKDGSVDDFKEVPQEDVIIPALPIKKDYNLEFKIDDVKQLRDLRVVDDAHLTQHIKINEEKMTMGDLCKPFFPIGEVSKNYERAVEGERKRKERQQRDSHDRRMARKYRLNEKEMKKLHDSESSTAVADRDATIDQKAKVKELMERDLTDSLNKVHNVPLLQIQNGQVVYSQESTMINRHGEESNEGLERVEENPYENIVTSNTYSKKKQTLRWTPQETAELFKAVSLWGTDFSLISQLFPYRTRKQIKAKFVLEEKKHPHLVEFALLRKLPVDIDEYSGKSGRQFKTLDEYNEELANVKQKHDEELKTMAAAKELALEEDRQTQQQNPAGEQKPRSRKAVIAEFRRNEEIVGSLD